MKRHSIKNGSKSTGIRGNGTDSSVRIIVRIIPGSDLFMRNPNA